MEANLRLISDASLCLSIHLMLRKDDLMEAGQGSLDQDCKAVQNDQMSVHSKQNWITELYHQDNI